VDVVVATVDVVVVAVLCGEVGGVAIVHVVTEFEE